MKETKFDPMIQVFMAFCIISWVSYFYFYINPLLSKVEALESRIVILESVERGVE